MRVLYFAAALSFIAAGCFTPPDGVGDAQRALAEAKAAGSAEYLPEEHAAVVAKWRAANAEVAREQQESAIRQSYQKANRLLDEVEEEATALREKTEAKKAEVRAAIVPEIQALMISADLVERAYTPYLGPEVAADFGGFQDAIDQARDAAEAGRYLEALSIIRAAQERADTLLRRVELDTGGV